MTATLVGGDDAGTETPTTGVRMLRLGVLLVPAVLVGIGGWVHRWTDEDAFINFRIVDQIFAGHGPVFNAGERVETYTSAAWLAVLTVARVALSWLMGPEWISVLLGLAAAVGGFALGGPRRAPAVPGRRAGRSARAARRRRRPRGLGLRDVGARDGSGVAVDRRELPRAWRASRPPPGPTRMTSAGSDTGAGG